jgi:hypothetical protein
MEKAKMNINDTLKERKNTHGEYNDHARVTQQILAIVMGEKNWARLSYIQKESLHMFAHKMGRISVGDPDEPDHWRDIAGYATLVADRVIPKNTFAFGDLQQYEKNVPGTPEDGGHHHKEENE